jgi:hypothetical protein
MQVRRTDGTVTDVEPVVARRLIREGNAQAAVAVTPEPTAEPTGDEDTEPKPSRSKKQ